MREGKSAAPAEKTTRLTAKAIADSLRTGRFRFSSEAQLQESIAEVLTAAGIPFEREVRLSAHDRADFLCGVVAIEVKIAGSLAALTRQVHRYAALPQVGAILVVTSRHRLAGLPDQLQGKPVLVVSLADARAF